MKAQISLVAIIVLMALGTAGFLGIIYSNNPVQETVEYNTGDYNEIAAAKLKADAYENRTAKELNYSMNIKALEMGENSGNDDSDDVDWDENVPSYEDDLKPLYIEAVHEHLRTQNDVIRCTNPEIEDIELQDSGYSAFEASLENPWITCTSPPLEEGHATEATVNVSDTLEVNNTDNRYLVLAEYASETGSESEKVADDRLPGPLPTEGTDTTTDCEDPDKSSAREDAKDEAKDEAVSQLGDMAGEAWDSVESDADEDEVDASRRVNFPDSDSSFNHADTETSECTYEVKVGEDEDGEPIYEEREGTEYEYTYEYDPSDLELEFDLTDGSGREVISSSGSMETLSFEFTYSKTL